MSLFSFSVLGVCSAFFLVLKSFNNVSRKFQGCFKEVARIFEGSFQGVYRKFRGYLKKVSNVFQGSFLCVSRMSQGNFKGGSRRF